MGYLIKSDVINALEEGMGNAMMCYEGKERKDIVAFCYESMERIIEELPQYWPDNMREGISLTPEDIRELKERDTAKAPEVFNGHWYKCPKCGMYAGGLKGNFCHRCGQRLKWEE